MSNSCIENVTSFPNPLFMDTSKQDHVEFSHPVEWLDALRTDNVEKATEILMSASTKYKDFLMNGDIPNFNGNQSYTLHARTVRKRSSMEFCITKPLHAAAIFHAHAVIQLLWASGVEVLQVDGWKNNVVHMLIYADYKGNGRVAKHAETLAYLQTVFSEKDLKSLLKSENDFSLRPLEFAALHGCVSMIDIIMQTAGIYLIKEEHVGYNVVQYFDLSDYELFEDGLPPRFYTTPLALLTLNETSRIGNNVSHAICHDPGLKSWIQFKITMNWPFAFIWFVFRMCYIGLFFSASLDNSWPMVVSNRSVVNSNRTEERVTCSSESSDVGNYQWYTLALASILMLIFDLYTYLRVRKLHHPAVFKMLRRRDIFQHVLFYHMMQYATCVSVMAISICEIVRSMNFAVPVTLENILFISASYGCMWGVVYFLQVLPWIGIYAIAIQRMMQVFMRFTLIFIIFLCAFAISFRRILLGHSNECPKLFDTLGETIYSSFLVMINSINFRQYENVDKTSLYFVHILFVFFISIMLLNFLIAIMTQSISDVFENREAIIQSQRLALMMTVQMRLAWPMRALYKILQRKVFVYRKERLCLRRVLIKSTNFGQNLPSSSNCSRRGEKILWVLIWSGILWPNVSLVYSLLTGY